MTTIQLTFFIVIFSFLRYILQRIAVLLYDSVPGKSTP